MSEPLSDRVIGMIGEAASLYNRLIVLVAPPGAGKTNALREVHQRINAQLININLELSHRMLELTERQRALKLPLVLSDIVDTSNADVILFDNIEVLFDVSLKQDPLRLLQGVSRNKTVVASWTGFVDGGYISYAKPDHPEYKRYAIRDFLVLSVDETKLS